MPFAHTFAKTPAKRRAPLTFKEKVGMCWAAGLAFIGVAYIHDLIAPNHPVITVDAPHAAVMERWDMGQLRPTDRFIDLTAGTRVEYGSFTNTAHGCTVEVSQDRREGHIWVDTYVAVDGACDDVIGSASGR